MRILFLGLRKIFRLRLLFYPEFSVIVEISWKRNGRSIGKIVLIMIFIIRMIELKFRIEIFLLRLDLDLLQRLLLLKIPGEIFLKGIEIGYEI